MHKQDSMEDYLEKLKECETVEAQIDALTALENTHTREEIMENNLLKIYTKAFLSLPRRRCLNKKIKTLEFLKDFSRFEKEAFVLGFRIKEVVCLDKNIKRYDGFIFLEKQNIRIQNQNEIIIVYYKSIDFIANEESLCIKSKGNKINIFLDKEERGRFIDQFGILKERINEFVDGTPLEDKVQMDSLAKYNKDISNPEMDKALCNSIQKDYKNKIDDIMLRLSKRKAEANQASAKEAEIVKRTPEAQINQRNIGVNNIIDEFTIPTPRTSLNNTNSEAFNLFNEENMFEMIASDTFELSIGKKEKIKEGKRVSFKENITAKIKKKRTKKKGKQKERNSRHRVKIRKVKNFKEKKTRKIKRNFVYKRFEAKINEIYEIKKKMADLICKKMKQNAAMNKKQLMKMRLRI